MVKIIKYVIIASVALAHQAFAQPDTLSLQYCYAAAKKLSPLKQQEIYNKTIHELSLKNHRSNYMPQLYLKGRASYQSEVFSIPGTGMVLDIPEIPKDQYQVSVNLTQNIYDGGLSKYAKKIEDSEYEVAEKELTTQLYGINEIINQLYFSSLQLQESLKILETTQDDLNNQKNILSASIKHGVVKKSNLYNVDKQLLSIEQEIIALESDKKVMFAMLSEWIGEPVDESALLTLPQFQHEVPGPEINRPELSLFSARKELLRAQSELSNVQRLPQFQAFGEAGIGQPNPFDFFEVDPSTFYIIGLQLTWQIYDWGNTNRKKQILQLRQNTITTREEDFKRNISIALTRHYADSEKLKTILEKDEEIIALQEKIVESTFSELNNGVVTSTEYLTELNNLTHARINRALHQLELTKTFVTIYTTTGQDF